MLKLTEEKKNQSKKKDVEQGAWEAGEACH